MHKSNLVDEKCNSLFLKKYKSKSKNDSIASITINNINYSNQEKVKYYLKNYWKDILKLKENDKNNQLILLNLINKVIDDNSKKDCDLPITKLEIENNLKTISKNKVPGIDGIPMEFYCKFPEFVEGILMVFNFCLKNNLSLPYTTRTSIIRLIPKKGDLTNPGNWRPLSLLSSDYKIIAKTLAMRLKSNLINIIGKEQTGFIPKRDIRSNILEAKMVSHYLKSTDSPGILLFLDIEKDF